MAFLLNGGIFTSLDVRGSNTTGAKGINNSGDIVGFYNAGGVDWGFLLSGGI